MYALLMVESQCCLVLLALLTRVEQGSVDMIIIEKYGQSIILLLYAAVNVLTSFPTLVYECF